MNTLEILFSAGFALIGVIAFQISYLVSGHNIYREMEQIEASFLSLAVGIVVFLFSPIGHIILFSENDADALLADILNFKSLLGFFCLALGIGFIFGFSTILNIRWNTLRWIRNKTLIPFWIFSYTFLWDDFFSSIKRGGKIYIGVKDSKMSMEGFLESYSIRKEPKELQIKSSKTNKMILVPAEDIKYIQVQDNSFKKHYEYLNHIGQAFYCIMISTGVFMLSYNGKIMLDYELGQLRGFYITFQYLFLLVSILILIISIWIVNKDFCGFDASWRFCPDVFFLVIFLIANFLILLTQNVPSNIIGFLCHLPIFMLFMLFYIPVRIEINGRLNDPLKKIIEKIAEDIDIKEQIKCEINDKKCNPIQVKQAIYNKIDYVLEMIYLGLCLNEDEELDFCLSKSTNKKVLNLFKSNLIQKRIAMILIGELTKLKQEKIYLRKEDINTLWVLKNKVLAEEKKAFIKSKEEYSNELMQNGSN